MSTTRVAVLTPPGTGAIATLAVAGTEAWSVVRSHFRRPLPAEPVLHQFWFGTLGDGAADEVVVAVKAIVPEPCIEIHCHGGRQVVRWLLDLLCRAGCVAVEPQDVAKPTRGHGWAFDDRALTPLTKAPTLRTASILLDQYHGAFAKAVADGHLDQLARTIAVGRHLVEPWRVVVAGPPNVGKSSLVNALAGYQRSVVASIPGTTRDVVTTTVAFDGWPVQLADTAGLRIAAEELEAAGIGLARRSLADADLVIWVVDASDPQPVWPDADAGANPLLVANKSDLPPAWDAKQHPTLLMVSSVTGAGVAELAAAIAHRLVPDPPLPGAAVPFTPALADLIERAQAAFAEGDAASAHALLADCATATA